MKMNKTRKFAKSLFMTAATLTLSGVLTISSVGAQSTPAATEGGSTAIPPFPSSPITLQIVDVAGEKQLVQGMIDNYVKANPDKVSKVDYIVDTAPNLPGRIKAQQDAGKID